MDRQATSDERRPQRRRRPRSSSLTCIMQKLSGQELELSNLTLTKVHQVEVLHTVPVRVQVEDEVRAETEVVGFWPVANRKRNINRANYARHVFIIFSREHNNSLQPQVDNVSMANDIRFEHAVCFKSNR